MTQNATLSARQRQCLADMLFVENCSCVIRNGDCVRIFREPEARSFRGDFLLFNAHRPLRVTGKISETS